MDESYPRPFPPPWADAWGDDRYGLWAALEVKGVVQRMRWIARGSFTMGSDLKEAGHQRNETPHQVTLTEGFWLADTACTQGLWEAVMGNNPSDLCGDPNRPVEQVSFGDVQRFFSTLAVLGNLPSGFRVCLPSEAQWEYACRAGSSRAYHFDDKVSTRWCNFNFDGDTARRYAAKQTTVPVKALPANRWGLYQMHGNVLEWCADGLRTYTWAAVSDPEGPIRGEANGAQVSVRGGAWSGDAKRARSANRLAIQRGGRSNALGFRFALRFT